MILGLRNVGFIGALGPNLIQTVEPTIGTLSCILVGGTPYLQVPVTNNDTAGTITCEYGLDSQTLSVGSGATITFQFLSSNPPGTSTVYAKATATGKSESTQASRTQNVIGCFGW